jgi:hypothetical protein
MATRKMTFTIPDSLAGQFLKRIPARERSQYVSDAIAAKLREHDEQIARACEIANRSSDILAIEGDWDALADDADRVEEPWNHAPPR